MYIELEDVLRWLGGILGVCICVTVIAMAIATGKSLNAEKTTVDMQQTATLDKTMQGGE